MSTIIRPMQKIEVVLTIGADGQPEIDGVGLSELLVGKRDGQVCSWHSPSGFFDDHFGQEKWRRCSELLRQAADEVERDEHVS